MILSKDRAISSSFKSINKLSGIMDADSTYNTLSNYEKNQIKSKKYIKSNIAKKIDLT